MVKPRTRAPLRRPRGLTLTLGLQGGRQQLSRSISIEPGFPPHHGIVLAPGDASQTAISVSFRQQNQPFRAHYAAVLTNYWHEDAAPCNCAAVQTNSKDSLRFLSSVGWVNLLVSARRLSSRSLPSRIHLEGGRAEQHRGAADLFGCALDTANQLVSRHRAAER